MNNKNQYYLCLIELIEKNLLGRKRSSESALKYFRSDAVSLEVCYNILKNYYKKRPTNFEKLYRETNYGSRQTIKTIIDHAIAQKFLFVKKNKMDLRKRDIHINKIFVKEFEKHMEELKNKLNSI